MKKLFLISLFPLLFFTACSQRTPGVLVDTEVWPYELYAKFNLRTTLSSYSNALKTYCASYPKDFYTKDQVFMPNTDKIIMENELMLLSFEFITQDQVIMVDEVKGGLSKTQRTLTLYYNEDVDEYRTDTFFIEKSEDCKVFVIKKDENSTEVKVNEK